MGGSIYSTILHPEDFKGCLRTRVTDDWEMYKYATRAAGNMCFPAAKEKRDPLTSTVVPVSRLALQSES